MWRATARRPTSLSHHDRVHLGRRRAVQRRLDYPMAEHSNGLAVHRRAECVRRRPRRLGSSRVGEAGPVGQVGASGSWATSAVPPGPLETLRSPPRACTRSASPRSPEPATSILADTDLGDHHSQVTTLRPNTRLDGSAGCRWRTCSLHSLGTHVYAVAATSSGRSPTSTSTVTVTGSGAAGCRARRRRRRAQPCERRAGAGRETGHAGRSRQVDLSPGPSMTPAADTAVGKRNEQGGDALEARPGPCDRSASRRRPSSDAGSHEATAGRPHLGGPTLQHLPGGGRWPR